MTKINARKKWWKETIGGAETQGRTYTNFINGVCPRHGYYDKYQECWMNDDRCYDECNSAEEEAKNIMEIARKRHEDTNYDELLQCGIDRETAREMIKED